MYFSEAAKIRPTVVKYLNGLILDYGCGSEKITPEAKGVDIRPLPGVDFVLENSEEIYDLHETIFEHLVGGVDVIFSSHFLEHVKEDARLMRHWIKMLKPGGVLILYLPDDELYDNSKNPDHLHRYRFQDFMERMTNEFDDLDVLECGPHVGNDLYSFYVIAARKG